GKGWEWKKVFSHVPIQFLAFAAFVTAMVAIMTAGFEGRDRLLNEGLIGQVAPFTIEASRDFPFKEKDVVASNRLRQEVALSVPSVYDWQEGLGESLRDQIRQAFSSMRASLAESAREQLAIQNPGRLAEFEESAGAGGIPSRRLIDTLSGDQRIRLAHQHRADHFDAHLKIRIAENDFEVFARRGFPVDVENAIAAMVSEAMSQLIIANVRRIDRELEHGIYLRRLRDDKLLIEYHVTDLDDRFIGLEQIPRLIEDIARREMIAIQGAEVRQAILSTSTVLARPNTTFNEAKTLEKRKAARDSVADMELVEEFRKGQIIVDKGHIVTERHFRIIGEMFEGEDTFQQTQILTGVAAFCLLLLMVLFVFGRKNIRRFQPRPKDIVFMGATLLLMLLLTRMGVAMSHAIAEQIAIVPVEAWYYAIPVAAGGMLIRLVLNSEHAVIFTILFAVLVGVIADNSLFFAAHAAMGSLVGITSVQQVKHRMALMWSGLAVGAVNGVAVVSFALIQGELFQLTTVGHLLLAFGGGLAAGFFISAVLPLFEAVFSYTTDIKLLELANLNHPALRELILRSPGSYHHSMMVGSLCEAAAESIGCNSLLARVGSYYHDIGKSKNPQYFAENQKVGENPHDKLKPNMSALIIKSHVKDGVDMARQHRLPVEIQDFIAQHHGTSLIAYFYHRAKELEDPDIPEVDEKDYRYPGPKPQSRETAICLLADGVEAASRAMPNPSPARLKGLVQTMINKAFTDGQLDECELTLKDLNSIAKAFTRILTGIYHHRPEYPGGQKKESEK
ncbi:MAG: HD family phosphohydrolase, partial [Bradymonadaceae bacterium]